MKKILGILILVIAVLLTACSADVNAIVIKDKESLSDLANKCGENELIGYEEIGDGEDRINTAVFRDKEYGFEYSITSRVAKIAVDTKVTYYEVTNNGFVDAYRDYILEKTGLDEVQIVIEKKLLLDTYDLFLVEENREALDKIKEIDKKRNFFLNIRYLNDKPE